MLKHPSRPELLAHAEHLVSGQAIAHGVARHLTQCDQCRREVDAIRRSLELVEDAPDLDAHDDLSQQILLAARNERQMMHTVRRRQPVAQLAKGLAFAAGFVVVCMFSFQSALDPLNAAAEANIPAPVVAQAVDADLSPETIRQTETEVRRLADAVETRGLPRDPQAWQQARAVAMLEADLRAAEAALQRNPGHERATRLMQVSLERQTEAWKSLYLAQQL
jgi:hypothetical protein